MRDFETIKDYVEAVLDVVVDETLPIRGLWVTNPKAYMKEKGDLALTFGPRDRWHKDVEDLERHIHINFRKDADGMWMPFSIEPGISGEKFGNGVIKGPEGMREVAHELRRYCDWAEMVLRTVSEWRIKPLDRKIEKSDLRYMDVEVSIF